MFALIIAIIAIALVIGVTVATHYYSGDSLTKGTDAANAARIVSQGQQITGAAVMFQASENRWPADVAELLSRNYLSSIPEAGAPWVATGPNVPQYVVAGVLTEGACRQVNSQQNGNDGIHVSADPTLRVQCFGPAEPYAAVFQIPGAGGALTTAGLQAASGSSALLAAAGGGAWAVEPTTSGVVVPPVEEPNPKVTFFYDNAYINSNRDVHYLTLTNTGNVPVSGFVENWGPIGINRLLSSCALNSLDYTTPVTLAPGQSCQVAVAWTVNHGRIEDSYAQSQIQFWDANWEDIMTIVMVHGYAPPNGVMQ